MPRGKEDWKIPSILFQALFPNSNCEPHTTFHGSSQWPSKVFEYPSPAMSGIETWIEIWEFSNRETSEHRHKREDDLHVSLTNLDGLYVVWEVCLYAIPGTMFIPRFLVVGRPHFL
jgi:hypothetical protein